MVEHKYFNGRKYTLSQGKWRRTASPLTALSWDVWNYHHPEDQIVKGDGYNIHHENEQSSDDRIENLQKITRSEHIYIHTILNKQIEGGILIEALTIWHYNFNKNNQERIEEFRKMYQEDKSVE